MGQARWKAQGQWQEAGEERQEIMIYKRGDVYWYKFMFDGQVIRQTTKQGNDKVARRMESAERIRLANERDERKAATDRLNCQQVLRCPECERCWSASLLRLQHRDKAFASSSRPSTSRP